jgi:hypothetical protein
MSSHSALGTRHSALGTASKFEFAGSRGGGDAGLTIDDYFEAHGTDDLRCVHGVGGHKKEKYSSLALSVIPQVQT